MKKHLPENTKLYTNKDLHKKVKGATKLDEMQFWQAMRGGTEGNAAALPAQSTEGWLFELSQKFPGPKVPDEIKGKNVIISDDKVHPAILAHEAGHIIDFDEEKKGGWPKKLKNTFSLPLREEYAAWEKAPRHGIDPAEFEDYREGALGTYKRALIYPLVGGGLGVGAGMLLDKYVLKK